jgi:hypothetical protein
LYGRLIAGGLAAGVLVVGAILAWYRLGRGRRARHADPRTARQIAAIQLYERMLRILESQGLLKSPGATPLEFARRVAHERGEAARFVEPLTSLYCRIRFGQAAFSSDDAKLAQELLTGLRTATR